MSFKPGLYSKFLKEFKKKFEVHGSQEGLVGAHLKEDGSKDYVRIRIVSKSISSKTLGFFIYFFYPLNQRYSRIFENHLVSIGAKIREGYNVRLYYSNSEKVDPEELVSELVNLYTDLNKMVCVALKLLPLYIDDINNLLSDFEEEVSDALKVTPYSSLTDRIAERF